MTEAYLLKEHLHYSFSLHIWVPLTNFKTQCTLQNTHAHTHHFTNKILSLKSTSIYCIGTYTSNCLLKIWLKRTDTHTHTYAWLLAQTHIHLAVHSFTLTRVFLLHACRNAKKYAIITRMQRKTQLAYLFHQCGTSLLSRDCRITDCTLRHPGAERPLSGYTLATL